MGEMAKVSSLKHHEEGCYTWFVHCLCQDKKLKQVIGMTARKEAKEDL